MCVTFGGDTAVSQHRILSNYLYSLVGAGASSSRVSMCVSPESSECETCGGAPSSVCWMTEHGMEARAEQR